MTPLIARAPVTATDPLRVAVLASGGGTNLQALLDHAAQPGALFRVCAVGVNKTDAAALVRAQAAGVAAFFEDHRGRDREAFEDALLAQIKRHGAELIVLAGFMRVLTAHFLDQHPRRVVNIHPALLPAFPGTHGIRQALQHGARVTGVTVHLVDAGVDTGPILAQRAVSILDDDTEESLSVRVHAIEHAIYPAVIDAIARGQVGTDADGRVRARGIG